MSLDLKDSDKIKGNFIHQLAARKRIQDLEEDTDRPAEIVEKAITKLGLEYKLASKFTSFIGVDTVGSEKSYAPMESRGVANQVPLGFGAGRGGGAMMRSGFCASASVGVSVLCAICTWPAGVRSVRVKIRRRRAEILKYENIY